MLRVGQRLVARHRVHVEKGIRQGAECHTQVRNIHAVVQVDGQVNVGEGVLRNTDIRMDDPVHR